MLGILGGMGPAATVDLMRRIVALTPAQQDDEHIPMIVSCDPRIPSLGRAILEDGESPLTAMTSRLRLLEASGAQCIAIACHAAFHWYDELKAQTRVPIIHMADAVCDALDSRVRPGQSVGLMAAASTLRSGYYQRKFEQRNFPCVVLPAQESERYVFEGIRCVKANRLSEAAALFRQAVAGIVARGASTVVLACTEIPVALDAVPGDDHEICIDGTDALACACIRWWETKRS